MSRWRHEERPSQGINDSRRSLANTGKQGLSQRDKVRGSKYELDSSGKRVERALLPRLPACPRSGPAWGLVGNGAHHNLGCTGPPCLALTGVPAGWGLTHRRAGRWDWAAGPPPVLMGADILGGVGAGLIDVS